MKFAGALVICLAVGALSAPSAKVEEALRETLKTKGAANVFVSFKEGTDKVLEAVSKTTFANRSDKLNGVANALRSHAQISQSNVLGYLNKLKLSGVRSFWISNQIFIKNANAQLVDYISTFTEVSEISEEKIIPLEPMIDGQEFDRKENRPMNEWGVNIIGAPEAWSMDGGNSGDGIVVANIDTGVRYTHETLRHNFRSEYGWYDPYDKTATPIDRNGHGTHTMGTIAGANGIGVAPNAKWIACRGCDTSSCSNYALLECGEFMSCPHLPNGSGADCSKAPNLVSNSWGGGQGNTFYRSVINAWHAADIAPLFSNGNSGPSCGSANSPADDPNAIGVGSTTSNDALSSFSSKGPSRGGLIKPDLSAPGSNVYSAWHTSDKAYFSASGTSMACPHVAGASAIILSRRSDLNVKTLKSYLTYGNANSTLVKPGYNCGGINESKFPNHAFGSGRINVFNSLVKLLSDS